MWSFNKVPTNVSVLKFHIWVMCLALFPYIIQFPMLYSKTKTAHDLSYSTSVFCGTFIIFLPLPTPLPPQICASRNPNHHKAP